MKDTITKDHFVCINLSIEDLHPENLVNLGLISRRLANRILDVPIQSKELSHLINLLLSISK